MPKVSIAMDEFEEMCESYMGFCTSCQEFTRDSTAPDAENYMCDECGKNTVIGAEQAMLTGKIEVN